LCETYGQEHLPHIMYGSSNEQLYLPLLYYKFIPFKILYLIISNKNAELKRKKVHCINSTQPIESLSNVRILIVKNWQKMCRNRTKWLEL